MHNMYFCMRLASSNKSERKNETDRSMVVLLLWIIYVISVLFCYAFVRVCLLMSCVHLLGKG